MSELQIFNNPEFGKVRVISKCGEPWFIASDVCAALEIGNPSQAMARLDDDEYTLISNEGSEINLNAVNEPGLYSLVLGSRKPEARVFKRWITHEVIPSIRKHGAYMTDETLKKAIQTPDFLIELAKALKEEKEQRRKAEAQLEAEAPLVLFAEAVQASPDSILIGELAKELKQNGVEIGRKRLFSWLRENGYLIRRGEEKNQPTQYSMERGLLEIKKGIYWDSTGESRSTTTTKVTAKGQIYFVNLFIKKYEQEA